MKSKSLILLVEDDESISNFITASLETKDYAIQKAKSGNEALRLVAQRCPDLILLDLGLPDKDGMEVLISVRSWSIVPIIVVSARSNEVDKVKALDMGADDYLTKPFGTEELLARIRNALRHQANFGESNRIVIDKLLIDTDTRRVELMGKEIHLTPIEFKLLLILAKNAGKVLTVHFLVNQVWGPYVNETNALRVNMANIRRKIEENPAEPHYIKTEVGVGYRMIEPI